MCVRPGGGRVKLRRTRCGIVRRRSAQERSLLRGVGEGLMMELEQIGVGRGVVRQRVIPTAGIPPPIDPRVIQPVADVRRVTWLARIGVVDQETLGSRSAGRERRQQWLRGVDREFAVERELVVGQDLGCTIVAR